MPTIQYPNNPNVETAFVEQDDGTKNRVVLTAAQDISTIEYPSNPNSTKAYITVNGKKQRVVMTADIAGGGGGSGLPDQTGHSGEFLITDGTDASWSDKPLVNTATGTNSVGVLGIASQDTSVVVGINATTGVSGSAKVAIGNTASATGNGAIAIGQNTTASGLESIAVGQGAKATGAGAVQIKYGTNSTADTIQFGSYTLVSADGTIPEARLADTTNAAQGQVLTLDSNLNAVRQAGGSGGGLPSQTGNAGKFLTTDGSAASWATINALTNNTTSNSSIGISDIQVDRIDCVVIGKSSKTAANQGTAIGSSATTGYLGVAFGSGSNAGWGSDYTTRKNYVTAIGANTNATANNAIAIGYNCANSTAQTLAVCVDGTNSVTLVSSDGTIPAARHASLPSADGTYVLKLVISGGVPTLSWVAE